MSDILKMLKLGLTLALYASVACLCLALINIFTTPYIEAAALAKANAAMKVVFPSATTFEEIDFSTTKIDAVKINAVRVAKEGDVVIGVGVEAVGPTYDEATILVGIDTNNTITGIEFLALTDTPGYGQGAKEPDFKNQFNGLAFDKTLEARKDFDAVSGSTITTNGVTAILNAAIEVGLECLAKEGAINE